MKRNVKRAIAIVAVVGIAVGIGIPLYLFLQESGGGAYDWSADDCPGAPSDISSNQVIKVGVIGDIGSIQGDSQWKSSWLAAQEINEAGGIQVNGKTYYIGVTNEDTDESSPQPSTEKAKSAAERLVYYKGVDFVTGGFRTEMVEVYTDTFMDENIPFLSSGAATDELCSENVRDHYSDYKYFFRTMPTNSTTLGTQILTFMAYTVGYLNATNTNDVTTVGLLYENLEWTTGTVGLCKGYLPTYIGCDPITGDLDQGYDPGSDTLETDIATSMQDLEDAGAQIVIPVISAQGGQYMMNAYDLNEFEYSIIGIDVESQMSEFWDNTDGSAKYETILQSTSRTNKTVKTIPMWDNYTEMWNEDPIYTGIGSYDSVYMLNRAISRSQSFDPDTIVEALENQTIEDPYVGAGGHVAFTSDHDIYAPSEGMPYPYGVTLFVQWVDDPENGGTKNVVQCPYLYPETLIGTQPIQVPSWSGWWD